MGRLKKFARNDDGFSLVELAVVLVIVGLLIGGILKGQDLIESARLKKVITQLNEYRVAASLFVDKYDSLPGDFAKATEMIESNLLNGNGNGTVGGKGLEDGSEALSFWSHMAAAGLIGYPGSKDDINIGIFGNGAPTSPIGGGFTVENNPADDLKGLWFILGNKTGNSGQGGLLTPAQAMSLDKKMDTGMPVSGKVQARDGDDMGSNSCVDTSGNYNLNNEEPSCVMYFQL